MEEDIYSHIFKRVFSLSVYRRELTHFIFSVHGNVCRGVLREGKVMGDHGEIIFYLASRKQYCTLQDHLWLSRNKLECWLQTRFKHTHLFIFKSFPDQLL